MIEKEFYNFKPLSDPIPITEQKWPEGITPLVHTQTMTYNHGNFIRECIEGILIQKTTFPVQILIHDDDSTDNTAEIVNEYQKNYPNLIKAYYQIENSYTKLDKHERRSEFMNWKKGKYIALCEGDDYWTDPYKLQKQVDFMENNPKYSFCGSEILIEDESGNILDKFPYLHKGQSKFIFNLENYLFYPFSVFHTSSIVMRNYTDFITDKLSKYTLGDLAITVALLNIGNGYMFNEKFSVYRIHIGGIWSNGSITPSIEKIKIKIKNYERLSIDYPSTKNYIPPIKKHLYNNLAMKYAKKGDIIKSLYYYLIGLPSSSDFVEKNWIERLYYNLFLYKKR